MPTTVNYRERIARARREIDAIEAEIRAGNPDVHGLCRGLVDWSCELRRLEKQHREMQRLVFDGVVCRLAYRARVATVAPQSGPRSREGQDLGAWDHPQAEKPATAMPGGRMGEEPDATWY